MIRLLNNISLVLKSVLRRRGKIAFLRHLGSTSSILDIGCGNNSPYLVKSILPLCIYTGIDVSDYNQSKPNLSDVYIVTTSHSFAQSILNLPNDFDAVISSHNLEHCDERIETLVAMLGRVKSGGMAYISFPSSYSLNFPSRRGTLNYYDDITHQGSPPNIDQLIDIIKFHGYNIEFFSRGYKPFLLRCLGILMEPFSKLCGKVLPGTWEYYGFEAIIWARKL